MVVVEASSERSEQFWARTLIGWHIVFWVLMAMLTVLGITSGLPDGKRFAALGAVVALSTAYQFVGRPAIGSRRRLPAYAYRLVLLASLMVLVALLPQAVFLMFIASAQIWLLSEDIREGAGSACCWWCAAGRRSCGARGGAGRRSGRSCRGCWSVWWSAWCSASGSSG